MSSPPPFTGSIALVKKRVSATLLKSAKTGIVDMKIQRTANTSLSAGDLMWKEVVGTQAHPDAEDDTDYNLVPYPDMGLLRCFPVL